jgi:hypothetical protein
MDSQPATDNQGAPNAGVALPRLVSGAGGEMLDKWAACREERMAVLEFWEWLTERDGDTPLLEIDIDKAIEDFHGINPRQLEKERRALLERQRAANAGGLAREALPAPNGSEPE